MYLCWTRVRTTLLKPNKALLASGCLGNLPKSCSSKLHSSLSFIHTHTYMYTLCKFVFGKKLTVLRIEPRALNMIGNQSTSTLYPQLWNLFFSITNLSYFVCVGKKTDREGTRLFGTNKETVERVMKWIWSKYIMFIQEHMIMKATLLYS